ncbi:MAG: ABC transporter ATP-binding protein [Anaerolineales bacterium]|jgi:ABC-2 type transport system ATP-binding protein
MPGPAIEIKDLVKYYGKLQALKGVTLNVEDGEVMGFLGPNGAGKTTTIRCMLDMIRPQGGSIRIFGIDPQKNPVEVRKLVGYLPGELNLDGNLKVLDALHYFGSLRHNQIDWNYVNSLADRIELDVNHSIKNLSKGNKQKVGILQALMHQPRLLILDEPTSGLDPLMQQEVYRILREARREGTTIFFSSHIINEVGEIADRVAIIREGVIIEETEPEILGHMDVRRFRVRFKDPVTEESLAEMPDVSSVVRVRKNVFTFEVEGEIDGFIKSLANFSVSDLNVERSSLEEIFLAYYSDGKGN